ncbi:hypothetical protein chiPu_0006556 [Chiloscyllium punctatum]|uniref:Uncharacterized protein n=1 Tax=Chiloscyllium punctatum TaxID=137246 RepID=A0A401SCJ4_CHIPU|nr:hypothetical protein [Chiloscyllium punctatum]
MFEFVESISLARLATIPLTKSAEEDFCYQENCLHAASPSMEIPFGCFKTISMYHMKNLGLVSIPCCFKQFLNALIKGGTQDHACNCLCGRKRNQVDGKENVEIQLKPVTKSEIQLALQWSNCSMLV